MRSEERGKWEMVKASWCKGKTRSATISHCAHHHRWPPVIDDLCPRDPSPIAYHAALRAQHSALSIRHPSLLTPQSSLRLHCPYPDIPSAPLPRSHLTPLFFSHTCDTMHQQRLPTVSCPSTTVWPNMTYRSGPGAESEHCFPF